MYYEGDFLGRDHRSDAHATIGTDIDFSTFLDQQLSGAVVVEATRPCCSPTTRGQRTDQVPGLAAARPFPGSRPEVSPRPTRTWTPRVSGPDHHAVGHGPGERPGVPVRHVGPGPRGVSEGTTGQGEFKGFQDLFKNPSNISAVQSYLESQAKSAYGH